MVVRGQVKKGEYFDSVTLMLVARELTALEGVLDAAVVMATAENRAILGAAGLMLGEFDEARTTDLLVSVKTGDEKTADEVLGRIDGMLARARKKPSRGGAFEPRSLEGALEVLPGSRDGFPNETESGQARLALISVAGRYAGREARRALERGLHVMLFSDNVPVDEELALKLMASERGLLMMGPDCGTAIINGIPLAFANAVRRGDIGMVAASGTGLQELTCIVSNEGCGVSQAIGTGGRDIKKAIGGIMFLAALEALVADPATKVVVMAGKPPHEDVLEKIRAVAERSKKPMVAIFQGARADQLPRGVRVSRTFHEAALEAVALSRGQPGGSAQAALAALEQGMDPLARQIAQKRRRGQRYVRGLFSGGSFCGEAQIVFDGLIGEVHSNVPVGTTASLSNPLVSVKNTVVDLGEDDFTVGRPHPMIDFDLRARRIVEEAKDPATAVILLDVVLGHGANPDPARELVPVVSEAARAVAVVCSVTGTDRDPQVRSTVEASLSGAGANVMTSNAMACQLAGRIVQLLGD